MAKLFPPLIEGVIPAFYSENGTVKITVPFSMNKAVSKIQVSGFVLKAKTVQSSTYLFTIQNKDTNTYNMEDSPWVTFILNDFELSSLRVGQFYKFQIAYIDNNGEIGYYSTIATGKYTSKPDLYIATANANMGLKIGQINMHHNYYLGCYKQNEDISEKVYSYEFNIYDSMGNLFITSGEQLHNHSYDTEINESYDDFFVNRELVINQSYYIQYKIKTINGLELATSKYRIMKKTSIETEMEASISAILNYDNGYIDINLIGTKNQYGLETPVTGAFLVTRACSDNNYEIWSEISRFKLQAQNPSRWLWRDYTVEQGKTYKYAIQQYNDAGLYSNRLESNAIYVDFEDAFLYDGKRQLKIRYNPKINSLKINILENKLDTIGSKHPFIFRNANTYYREFPISGLISYLMDEQNLFMAEEDFITSEKTTNFTSENLIQERLFKTEVLEWLTDGNPKVFRSPTEGNFIVRLLNVSLTPNDSLGRMLHTFNCTAYEIAEFNYDELNSYGFISLIDPEVSYLRFKTINFSKTVDNQVIYLHGQVNDLPAITVRIDNMMPGDIFKIINKNGESQTISIGVTGSYYIDLGTEITAIIIPEDLDEKGEYIYNYNGSMTYSYYSTSQNLFNKIDNVNIIEVPTRQFFGECDLLHEISKIKMQNNTYYLNPKVDLLHFYWIHASKKMVERIVEFGGQYYIDMNCTIRLSDPDPFTLYEVGEWILNSEYSPIHKNYIFKTKYFIDFNTGKKYDSYNPSIYINNNEISLAETITYTIEEKFDIPQSFIVGNGVTVECAYQVREIDYLIENDASWNTEPVKIIYLNKLKEFREWQNQCEIDEIELDSLIMDKTSPNYENNYKIWLYKIKVLAAQEENYREAIKNAYKVYIQTLISDQQKEAVSEVL